MDAFDLVIVGAGNAALSAAISAKENGAKNILVLEKASKKDRGGNSRYTNGAYRFAYKGFSDLKKIIPNLKHTKKIDYGKYLAGDIGSTLTLTRKFSNGWDFGGFFTITDGEDYLNFGSAQDYKRIGDNDTGPNTGGMGTISPAPILEEDLNTLIQEKIVKKTKNKRIKIER